MDYSYHTMRDAHPAQKNGSADAADGVRCSHGYAGDCGHLARCAVQPR